MHELIQKIAALGIHLSVQDNNLKLQYKGPKLPAEVVQEIKQNKQALVQHLSKYAHQETLQEIAPAPQQESHNLSRAQLRLWLLSQFEQASLAYNMYNVSVWEENINIPALKQALQALVQRHEVLRARFFVNQQGLVQQQFYKASNFEVPFEQVPMQKGPLEKQILGYLAQPFDLAKGPLIRFVLIEEKPGRYYFLLIVHHLVADGVSVQLIYKEMAAYYRAILHNQAPQLQPLTIQYKDYVHWEEQQLQSPRYQQMKSYWQSVFNEPVPVLELPTNGKRPEQKTYNGGKAKLIIPEQPVQAFKQLLRTKEASLFAGMLTLVNMLLYRYTGQSTIVLGTPVSGRPHPQLENQMGLYLNTLALKNTIDPTQGFLALLEQVKNNSLQAINNQQYPFDQLLEDLNLAQDASRSPLFDVMINLQSLESASNDAEEENLEKVSNQKSQFDLSFDFVENSNKLYLRLIYNADLFEQATIDRMLQHVNTLFNAVLLQPEQPAQSIDLLPPTERQQLLHSFNNTQTPYAHEQTLLSLWQQQVATQPNNVAVAFEQQTITFKALDQLSNRLAHYLINQHQVAPAALVGVQLEKGFYMVAAILAIIKTGGAYVPIDPKAPAQRLAFIEQDCQLKALIDPTFIAAFEQVQQQQPQTAPPVQVQPHDLAYVIYTSGSTGQPKGVPIAHTGAVNRIEWMWKAYGFNAGSVVLQKTTYTFDVSVWEIFMPLCWGCQMVLCTAQDAYNPQALAQLIHQHQVSHLHFVPSMLKAFVAALEGQQMAQLQSLKGIITSGEELPLALVQQWYGQSQVPIYNLYGPTEASIDVTYYNTTPQDNTLIPIGQPIANTQVHVLNQALALQPIGAVGEICLAGIGLSKGYLNRPELTAQKFVPNPFETGTTLYRTGDLGRWLPNGQIQYLGRMDQQVKIRGYRIELGEIESVLANHPGVSTCTVQAPLLPGGEKELVAYVVPAQTAMPEVAALKQHLAAQLPAYMVPGHFVPLTALPLTPNGKLNKKALPAPQPQATATQNYVAPTGTVQQQLAGIWAQALGMPASQISANANFFNLGGHSLKVLRVSTAIKQALGVQLDVPTLFELTTIEQQAVHIEQQTQTAFEQIQQVPQAASYPLSSAQHRLWVLCQFEGASAAYNMPGIHPLNGPLNVQHLEQALSQLVARHESLRTVFRPNSQKQIQQYILPPQPFELPLHNFENQDPQQLKQHLDKGIQQAFNLEQGPLFKAALYKTGPDQHLFFYMLHHIVADGVSLEVLVQELMQGYQALQAGQANPLPPLRIQYKDYATWQQNALQQDPAGAKQYWLNRFASTPPALPLPTDRQRPPLRSYAGGAVQTQLQGPQLQALNQLAQQQNSTLFMLLLAAVKTLLYRYTGQQDITVGSPVAGRDHADLQGQIGFFVNTLAMRTQLNGQQSFEQTLQQVRQTTLQAYKHQAYPFDELVQSLDLKRDTARHPLFDVMVTYQKPDQAQVAQAGSPEQPAQGSALTLDHVVSKFDLSINFTDQGQALQLGIEYSTDLFEPATAQRMLGHLQHLLQAVARHPQKPLQALEFLPLQEQDLLHSFNNTQQPFDPQLTLVSLFEQQVQNTPQNIALVFEQQQLTYAQLNQQANQWAHWLTATHAPGPNTIVGLSLPRGNAMVVALLGVLKAGAAYLPIDPEYPQGRKAYMQQNSQCALTIDQQAYQQLVPQLAKYPNTNPTNKPAPNNLAYVIYTSGSTGQPKGVKVPHKGIVNTILAQNQLFNMQAHAHALQFASYAFDASVSEIFTALTTGTTLHTATAQQRQDPQLLTSLINQHHISLATLPPAFFKLIEVAQLKGLTTLVTAGEAAVYQQTKAFMAQGGRFINAYGPTEASICATAHTPQSLPQQGTNIPIGAPIANTQAYVLNEQQQLQPIGVPGQLYIAGQGLAQGYLHNAEFTAQKFVPNPFVPGTTMYRTGDLARWLPNGQLQFLGRVDTQIKLNGYRVEPGEIEAAIQQHPQVQTSAVVLKQSPEKTSVLVAYVVPGPQQQAPSATQLRQHLAAHLPAHMLPQYVVPLPKLPLTTNGKLNVAQLPNPTQSAEQAGTPYVEPRTEAQRQLASLWAQVLNMPQEQVSIKANFFDLGGNSIKLIELQKVLATQCQLEVPVATLFKLYDIEAQAQLFEQQPATPAPAPQTEGLMNEAVQALDSTLDLFGNN